VKASPDKGRARVADFLLYGIDELGDAVFSEMLQGCDRATLRARAGGRLRDWPAVEIWEGPMCIVRLKRAPASPDAVD
jgi:hypothetical protein